MNKIFIKTTSRYLKALRVLTEESLQNWVTAEHNEKKTTVYQISANNSTPLCYSKKLGIRVLFGVKIEFRPG